MSNTALVVAVWLCWMVSAPAYGQTFVLQGEPGFPGEDRSALQCDVDGCVLNGSLSIGGSLRAEGRLTADRASFAGVVNSPASLQVDDLRIQAAVNLPRCPSGYQPRQGDPQGVVCERPVEGGLTDQVVAVGDFWIDRYEVSVWQTPGCGGTQYGAAAVDDYPATFPDAGDWAEPLYACSLEGVSPAGHLTWHQAVQACAQAGKDLCSNAMWQAAVAGTPEASCNVDTGEVAAAGSNEGCASNHGAFDMVGNRSEWVAEWYMGGLWPSYPGPDSAPHYFKEHWPFFVDLIRNWSGRVCTQTACDDPGDFLDAHPAAALRGGGHTDGTDAGPFTFDVLSHPDRSTPLTGARCCIRR